MIRRQHSIEKRPTDVRSWWGSLRTFIWVSLIAVLIWVWADLERTGAANLSVTMKIVSPEGANLRVISPDPELGRQVLFTVEGPQRRLTDFAEKLRQMELKVTADPSWPGSERSVSVAGQLSSWAPLTSAGLTVRSAAPESIRVVFDRWVVREAKVKPVFIGPAAPEGEPVVTPSTVPLRIPSSQAELLGPEPVIETEPLDLTGLPAGEELRRKVNLASRIGQVKVEPGDMRQVELTFTIGTRLRVKTFTATVEVKIPSEWLEGDIASQYTLVANQSSDWQRQLEIEGPPEAIDRMKDKYVLAFITVSSDDLGPASWLPHPVTVILPPGTKVRQPTEWKVDLRFEKRAVPATP